MVKFKNIFTFVVIVLKSSVINIINAFPASAVTLDECIKKKTPYHAFRCKCIEV